MNTPTHCLKSAAAAFFLLCCMTLVSAFEPPRLRSYLTDQTGLFAPSEKTRIEMAARGFEKTTGGQLFIAVLEPPEDVSIEEAGIKLMDAWKPGHKGKDDGAILILIPATHKMRLEIGYGWEGCVNDAKAGDILRLMAPYFQKNQYCEGVIAGIRQLSLDVSGKKIPSSYATPRDAEVEDDTPEWLYILLIIGLVVLCIRYPWLLLFFLAGTHGGRRGGGGGGGFGGGGGGRGGGGGASGGW